MDPGTTPIVTPDILPWTSGKLGLGPGKARLIRQVGISDTIGSLLNSLAIELDGFDEWVYSPTEVRVHEHCTLLLNGRAFEGVGGLSARVHPGDVIAVLPGFSGG